MAKLLFRYRPVVDFDGFHKNPLVEFEDEAFFRSVPIFFATTLNSSLPPSPCGTPLAVGVMQHDNIFIVASIELLKLSLPPILEAVSSIRAETFADACEALGRMSGALSVERSSMQRLDAKI